MTKKLFRNLTLALTFAVLLAAPLRTFADVPVVGGTDPDPGGPGDYLALVLALAIA